MKNLICTLLCCALLLTAPCCALASEEIDDSNIYTLTDLEGNYVTSRAGRMYIDDE
jgi:hypothetical protein